MKTSLNFNEKDVFPRPFLVQVVLFLFFRVVIKTSNLEKKEKLNPFRKYLCTP